MTQLQEQLAVPATRSAHVAGARTRTVLSPARLNVLRVGYLVVGAGLAVTRWPLLAEAEGWGLDEGALESMLIAMSVLALLGLRHPLRMLPVLLFEVAWKLTWLAAVAAPKWLNGELEGAVREQAGTVLWVVIVLAVVPWRYVLAEYVLAPGEPWRRRR